MRVDSEFEVTQLKGKKIMKLYKSLFVLCLVLMTALPAVAQKGPNGPNGGSKSTADCPLATTVVTSQPLSDEEKAWLVYMREEEKLALDVYQALYEKWNLRIFANIAASEQKHFDAIGTLLERYGLEDPAQDAGVFINSHLQALYNELIAAGLLTLVDAMEVGVEIENADIKDLQDALGATDNLDIKTVYINLLAGSLKHLNAFESHLELLSVQVP